ncbi:MAG: type II toxin-antitoxin system HicA family toxin [Chloroflexota bacterium]
MRLYSSQQVVKALQRLGCKPHGSPTKGKKAKGSHQAFTRTATLPDGTTRTYGGSILLGEKEMSRYTLKGALKTLHIDEADFEAAVR